MQKWVGEEEGGGIKGVGGGRSMHKRLRGERSMQESLGETKNYAKGWVGRKKYA